LGARVSRPERPGSLLEEPSVPLEPAASLLETRGAKLEVPGDPLETGGAWLETRGGALELCAPVPESAAHPLEAAGAPSGTPKRPAIFNPKPQKTPVTP